MRANVSRAPARSRTTTTTWSIPWMCWRMKRDVIIVRMPIIERIRELHGEMTAWRRDIHAHPETAFEEHRTSQVVAGLLTAFGLEVHRGLAKTGVVGSLHAGSAQRAIALRADLDALHIREENAFAHRTNYVGRIH